MFLCFCVSVFCVTPRGEIVGRAQGIIAFIVSPPREEAQRARHHPSRRARARAIHGVRRPRLGARESARDAQSLPADDSRDRSVDADDSRGRSSA